MMHASFQTGCHDSIDVLWVVFICLLHPVKHACFQTISSKEDNDELSSTRSVIGAQMRDAGEGPVDSLTPCPNRDAPVLPP